LTDTSAYYNVLSWDGDQIIGLRQQINSRFAASSELYAVAATGTDFRVLADLPVPLGRIVPAPAGGLVAFTEDEDCKIWPCNAHEAIHILDLISGASRQLVDADNYRQGLRWSPDNLYLLYEVPVDAFQVDLHVVEIATGSQWQLAQAALRNHGAHWSPDSRRVAYQRVTPGQPPRVYISDVMTRQQVALPVSSLDLGAANLQWSPDSQWLAFQETSSGGPQCRRGISLCNDIYLLDIDRALVFNLTRHRFNIQQFLWQW
jgi:dipeptidyl aminopeptidase/acylaminoacyl peptidase